MSNSVIPWTIVYIPGQNTAVGSLSRLQGIFPTQVGSHFISPGHLLSSIYLGTSSSCFLIGILFCLTFWRELNSLWSFQNEYVYIYIFLMYMYVCVFVYFWKPSTSPPQLSEWRCHKPHIFLILLYFLKILFIYLFIYLWTCWISLSAQGPSLVAAHGLLIAVVSLVAEHRL